MTRAQLFALSFPVDAGSTLHIYDDGYLVIVVGSADSHLDARAAFSAHWRHFEEAWLDVGISAFVIEDTVLEDIAQIPSVFVGYTSGFHDHRQEDAHTVRLAEKLFQSVLRNRDTHQPAASVIPSP